ncbi:glycosyltransferase [Clostridium paraputrificum]|uniref:Putative glycosyl transferase n=1 Tax=Clostridium paraputrificum TaxID=29363 RepID=A0A6N3DEM6_9CLOT
MVTLLIPTLGEREYELHRLFKSLEVQDNKNFDVVVISQGNHENVEKILSEYNIKFIHVRSDKRGLSLARNLGLKYVRGDKMVLSDDDAWYPQNAISTVIDSFNKINADVICFKIFDPIKQVDYKNYTNHKSKVDNFQIMKKSSVEICFDLDKIGVDVLKFNEEFGLGAKYSSGEENIILKDILNLNYSIIYENKILVYHEKKQKVTFNLSYIETKSMLFKILFGKYKAFLFLNALLLKNISKIEGNKIKGIIFANRILL